MPEIIKCGICGKRIRVKNFKDQMDKIRSHRKRAHPKAFRQSVKKGIATRRRGGRK